MNKIVNANCIDYMNSFEFQDIILNNKVCIVTDPPFNIGYHYNEYKDRLKEDEYYKLLKEVFSKFNIPFVVIAYPEILYKLSVELCECPIKVCSWVYNSNTAKQHRDIAFFRVKPNMSQVVQPYKNPTDKRIKERMAKGILGGKLYDWWNINQVKNVQKKGINHPCIMPLEVMKNIIGVLPKDLNVIYDPFVGSGTTGIATNLLGKEFIGTDINENYCEIAEKRIGESRYIYSLFHKENGCIGELF